MVHEMSIVMSLVELCERHAKAQCASVVHRVFIRIGTQSGVEPDMLHSAFDTFKNGTICEGATCVMEVQDVMVKCRQCGAQFDPKIHDYTCPECHRMDSEVIAGHEMHLMSLEME
jgi:hydrogenase nickel incorporation protein HypA/HybF